MLLPLKGITVLEFSQYLSGPSAALRLADLGAHVIKIERPNVGEMGRKLAIKDMWADESSLLFHTINRNKNSIAFDLKNKEDIENLKKLISKADVLIHNFRPGVMEKLDLHYESIHQLNDQLVYAEISGYGNTGPWKSKPGQDLLLQAITGLTYTSGNASNNPIPFGIAIGDILSGAHLVQGILAALIKRQKTKKGVKIEVSILESLLDFQFELLTTYFCDNKQPQRSQINSGHPLLSAPYGIYKTLDSYIALAMMDIADLGKATHCKELLNIKKEDWFASRDEIKKIIANHFIKIATIDLLKQLQENNLWAMEVYDWKTMQAHNAYKSLALEQEIDLDGKKVVTTRCPIRINGNKLVSTKSAPKVGTLPLF
jgi:CoA:oxalate CoA-transferase